MAFANGSAFGQGLGNSNEKLFYLPEAHNDFIFSVIGEELGFIGVMVLIALFVAFIYFGFKLALQVRDRVAVIMASSIVFVLGLQALLNMGVVLGLLPTKGLNLPFVSYGGSSLLCNFFGIGLLLSVIKGYRDELSGEETSSRPKRAPRSQAREEIEQEEVYT
jgi:cell division protein FtsW